MKKRIATLLAITISFLVTGCGGTSASSEPLSLVGNWTATGEDKYHCGIITDDSIEIYWIDDTLDSNSLYWAGSYEAPTEKTDTYSWESKNDKTKTDKAMMASGDDTKTFTYEDGKLSFSFGIGGMEGKSVLVMTDAELGTELDADSNSNNADQNISDDVEVLSEYTLADGIGWFTRHYMVVKNNSEQTVDISTSSLAYKEDGTMVSAADSKFYALGSGCTSVIYEAFETDEKISYYETDLKASRSKNYESVIQDLSYVQNDVKDGAVFQVTNNGEDDAEFVEGYALFFLNDALVECETAYFTDDDSEIKSGETISKQMTAYENFDRIEFYMTGRK